jgi:hypothetical protein
MLIILVIVAILISSCTTRCVPIEPTGTIKDSTGNCYVIINGTAFPTTIQFVGERDYICKEIVPNETNLVTFDAAMANFPINGVCK